MGRSNKNWRQKSKFGDVFSCIVDPYYVSLVKPLCWSRYNWNIFIIGLSFICLLLSRFLLYHLWGTYLPQNMLIYEHFFWIGRNTHGLNFHWLRIFIYDILYKVLWEIFTILSPVSVGDVLTVLLVDWLACSFTLLNLCSINYNFSYILLKKSMEKNREVVSIHSFSCNFSFIILEVFSQN